jgi:ABC-type sugar transport system ATPase subunit
MMRVEVEHLTHGYNTREVLDGGPVLQDLRLSFEPGQFTVIVGPSGCGKSTLLRLLAGLERPQQGRILFDGVDVSDTPARARNVAMVFQSYALYPHLTVRGNLDLTLRLAKLSRHERNQRVEQVAAFLELTELLDRRPAALSGGQRQRVAMGRALVRRPGLFLFDEPLSNLDAELRQRLRAQIKRLHREFPATKIYVTHDQTEAMTLADQVVVLKGGQVQQVASPSEVYRRPANLFVAQFFGSPSINLLKGGSADVSPKGWSFKDEGLRAAIRPEDVLMGAQAADASTLDEVHCLEGHVLDAEHLGSMTIVHFDTPLGALSAIDTHALVKARSGDRLPLALPRSRLHWFSQSTGKRIESQGSH